MKQLSIFKIVNKKGLLIISGVLLITVISFLLITKAQAAIITWDGGGADNNWSTCANWSGDTCPGSGDVATFDGTSTKDATIDTNIDVSGIDINTGYTGTITQGTGNTVTVGSGGYTQSDGVFTGGDSDISVYAFTLSGGTFTASSGTTTIANTSYTTTIFTYTGGTFNHNSGTLKFYSWYSTHLEKTHTINLNSGSLTVNDLTYSGGNHGSNHVYYTLGADDTFIVEGDLTMEADVASDPDATVEANNGTIQVEGDVTVNEGLVGGSTLLQFTGTNNQTYTDNGGNEPDGDITINKSSGTVTLASAANWNATNQDVTITEGTLDLAGYNLTTNTFTVEDGGTMQWQGDETVTVPTLNSGSTVTYTGASSPVTVSDWSYKTLKFNAPGKQFNWTASATYTVAENFNVSGRSDNEVIFRSTSDGTAWGIDDTGASDNVCYADVKDSTATVGITAKSGVDSGNNTNWTFSDESCYVKKFKGGMRFKGGIQIK